MGSLITETPFSEITATLEILDHLGVGRDDLKKFRAAAPQVQSHMAHIFKTADSCIAISSTSTDEQKSVLSVDYGQTLDQMIAAGHYDWKNDDITAKKFPVVDSGIEQFEAKIFHFDRNMTSEQAIKAIKAAGWEPGKIEHLLAFGAKYPEEQRKYPIIALGSVAEVIGDRCVPYLDRGDAERDLDLGWFDGGWGGFCRFLAVRKLSSAT